MTFLKDPLITILDGLGLATWLEISTAEYIYFFGPFLNEAEAAKLKEGYVTDLKAEGAKEIQVRIKQCRRPERLTIERAKASV